VTTFLLAVESGGAAEAVNEVVETTSGAIGVSWLVPLLPLAGFALILLLGRRLRERSAFLATGLAGASFLVSVAIWLQVAGEPATHIRPLFTWIGAADLQVAFDLQVDQLTAVMLLVVTGVGSLVHLYSYGYMYGDERFERYFAYLNLFLFSMLVLVLGANFLTLFLGWELVGLSSYLLIGFWFEKRDYAAAAQKAFITNRVGDVSFMIAMFVIFGLFGTLTFTDVLPEAASVLSGGQATLVVLLLMGGAAAKSAQIPLYVWLPDAMAGPTPVSALIHAATMVTAGVYLMVRTSAFVVLSPDAMTIIAWIGGLTALLAALIAIRQDDIKKILAYSTVSQLGYMFLGVGVGAFREGIFHLVTHAFFKGLLFLAAGSVMHALANRTDIWRMGGLRRVMPITFWSSAAAWLAISAIFPFAGFFSKDQILTTAYEHGFTAVWALGVLVAVLTAFYMSRWFFLVFLGEARWRPGESVPDPHAVAAAHPGGAGATVPPEDATDEAPSAQDAHVTGLHPHESPGSMTVPLIVLGALSAVGGAVLNPVHDGPLLGWLEPVVASTGGVAFAEHGPLTEPMLVAISLAAGLLGIGLAWLAYVRRPLTGVQPEVVRGAFAELMERKFYVDELYQAVFVRLGGRVADGMVWFDQHVVDGIVNGAGSLSTLSARVGRRVQSGFVRGYLASVAAGTVVLVAVLLIQVR
jgi:NADH-quinone oxidoreductase subunit L